MIAHDIEIFKPVIPSYNNYGRPLPTPKAFPEINNDNDLEEWKKNGGLAVGDYITYQACGITTFSLPYSVYKIIELPANYAAVQRRQHTPAHPLLIRIERLRGTQDTDTSTRWDDVLNARKLSEQEIKTHVEPWLDRVRNHSQPQA